MKQPRQHYSAKQTQRTTATTSTPGIDIIDVELHDLYTPIAYNDALEPKATPNILATDNMAAMDDEESNAEAAAYKLAYFDKSGDENVPVSYDYQVLSDYAKNDAEAKQDLMLLEEKTDFRAHDYSAMVRPSRSELRKQMRQAVSDYRQLSVADVRVFEFQHELQLFWNALERKTMHHMQAAVKKKNVTIQLGHLRPETLRLLEFNAPVPAFSKFSDKSTNIYGSTFKYQQYTMVFKYKDSKSNGYGIPCDSDKRNKWFLIKYQSRSKRWHFVKVSQAKFVYDFLLQEMKLVISFNTWLHMPGNFVNGIEQDHWTCI